VFRRSNPCGAEEPVTIDFRTGMNGLVAKVAEALKQNPYEGGLFIFRGKRSDRLKWLYFDGTGLIHATKWLEAGKFRWPPIKDGVVCLNDVEMSMLIDGLDWMNVPQYSPRRKINVA
jgi:transposase